MKASEIILIVFLSLTGVGGLFYLLYILIQNNNETTQAELDQIANAQQSGGGGLSGLVNAVVGGLSLLL